MVYSVAPPSGLKLNVGATADTTTEPRATAIAASASTRDLPPGRCPDGNRIVSARNAVNVSPPAHDPNQASRKSRVVAVPATRASRSRSLRAVVPMNPIPMISSSHPMLFRGRRMTSSAPASA